MSNASLLKLARAHTGAVLPKRMTSLAAGLDLFACLLPEGSQGSEDSEDGEIELAPGERALVPTGWKVAIAAGYEGQVRPRSGLALRQGVTVLNAPGTIDADYRGELRVLLVNLGQVAVRIAHGDRIAQLVIAPVAMCVPEEVSELDHSERGSGGFGSTGVGSA